MSIDLKSQKSSFSLIGHVSNNLLSPFVRFSYPGSFGLDSDWQLAVFLHYLALEDDVLGWASFQLFTDSWFSECMSLVGQSSTSGIREQLKWSQRDQRVFSNIDQFQRKNGHSAISRWGGPPTFFTFTCRTFSLWLRKAVNVKVEILTIQYEEEGVTYPKVISVLTAVRSPNFRKVGWYKVQWSTTCSLVDFNATVGTLKMASVVWLPDAPWLRWTNWLQLSSEG